MFWRRHWIRLTLLTLACEILEKEYILLLRSFLPSRLDTNHQKNSLLCFDLKLWLLYHATMHLESNFEVHSNIVCSSAHQSMKSLHFLFTTRSIDGWSAPEDVAVSMMDASDLVISHRRVLFNSSATTVLTWWRCVMDSRKCIKHSSGRALTSWLDYSNWHTSAIPTAGRENIHCEA